MDRLPGQTDLWRAGTARTLKGDIYPLSLFVCPGLEAWESSDRSVLLTRSREAYGWLQEQAKGFGVDLHFHKSGAYGLTTPYAMSESGLEHAVLRKWLTSLLRSRRAPNMHWVIDHARKKGCDQSILNLFVNAKGRSYCWPVSAGSKDRHRRLETSVLFRWNRNGTDLNPSAIAHEVLHLFGAWDLYETERQRTEVAEWCRKKFPNEIMHRTGRDIGKQMISPLTAWRVGWTEDVEDWFEWCRPASGTALRGGREFAAKPSGSAE